MWNRLSFASFRLLYADNRNCDSGRGEFFCRSGAYGKCTGKIQPFDSYLLPVTITSVEGAQADHIQQTVYYLLSGAEDVWAMPLADRSAWQVVDVSSEETSGEGSENGHAIHAFDGLKGTFWHTQWKGNEPQPPHHIVVDMGQEVKMLGFQ